MFIQQAKCAVGVFINRQFVKATDTIIIINSEKDLFLLNYANTLQRATNTNVTVLNRVEANHPEYQNIVKELYAYSELQQHGVISDEKDLTQALLREFNFMLISYETWNIVSEDSKKALQKMPSTLILSK